MWARMTTSQPPCFCCFSRYLYIFERKSDYDCCHIALKKKEILASIDHYNSTCWGMLNCGDL